MTSKAQKRAATDERILAEWASSEEEFGEDKSTEFLTSIVAERTGVDYSRVIDALFREAKANGTVISGA